MQERRQAPAWAAVARRTPGTRETRPARRLQASVIRRMRSRGAQPVRASTTLKLASIYRLVVQAAKRFVEVNATRLAAALSFYTLLSLAPLLLVVLAVAGLVFGRAAVGARLVNEIGALVGQEGAEVTAMVLARADEPGEGWLSMLIGFSLLLVGASGVFVELQDALNTIWGVKERPGRGIVTFLRKRLLSFGMVIGIGFLLLVSLVISAGLAAIGAWSRDRVPSMVFLFESVNVLLSFGMITLLFALMYKFVPETRITWHDVWIGAVVTALLFTAGKFLIGLYLGRSGIGSAYGAAGSIVVLIVWVYYSSLIVFLGAEITQHYARTRGSRRP